MKKYWYILILLLLSGCGMEQDYAAAEEMATEAAAEAPAEEAGEGPKDDTHYPESVLTLEHAGELEIIKGDLTRRIEQAKFYQEPENDAFAIELGFEKTSILEMTSSDLIVEERHDFSKSQYRLIIGSPNSKLKAKYHVQFEEVEEGDLQIEFVEFFESSPRSSDQSPSK